MDANVRSAVGANVVLVRAELAALSCDTLQLLLSRRVSITDLEDHALVADRSSMKLLDNLLALLASLKPSVLSEASN